MESCGEPLKIHISPQCKNLLDKLGGYITEKRGIVTMKGKGDVITHWLTGATEAAIQKRNFDLRDLPPPLFCRPRKSPKYCDSKQPSISCITNFGASDNRSMLCDSRRQSNAAQRYEMEGINSSFHGSLTGYLRESSPFVTKHRRLDNTPLFINNNDSITSGDDEDMRKGLNGNSEEQEQNKRQVAMVGPMIRSRKILNSTNSSSEDIGKLFF